MRIPDNVNLAEYYKDHGMIEAEDLHGAAHWRDEIHDIFDGKVEHLGACMPWSKTHNYFRFRPSETTLHAGINGHRKSMATGQMALWLAQHQKVAIASLEMKPAKTLERIIKQAAGAGNPPKDFRDAFLDWADSQILIYDRLDTTPAQSILGLCYYAGLEMGIEHVFIDSLAKLGMGEDDYNGQKKFMDELAVCARKTGIHVHMIAHMRKGKDEYEVPGKFGVKGSGALVDLTDNLIVHWKNKAKEEIQARADYGAELTAAQEEVLMDCDQILKVEKQRHGEHESQFKLWFHKDSLQFVGDHLNRPIPFEFGYRRQA